MNIFLTALANVWNKFDELVDWLDEQLSKLEHK